MQGAVAGEGHGTFESGWQNYVIERWWILVKKPTRRFPPWIKSSLPKAASVAAMRGKTYGKGLHTVCREARCPNEGECSARGAATFLILGDKCTRNCSFCAVTHGKPAVLREGEAELVAGSVASLGLRHVVVTSVTRDDLPDGGSSVFSETVRAIRKFSNRTTVEVLIPDFQGSEEALRTVIASGPDVIGHNLETVPRLYPVLRKGASYKRSLELLRRVGEWGEDAVTKSGIMVGVGETREEIMAVVRDLVDVRCAVLTIGQYLQPTPCHHPVHRFVPPEEFEDLKELAIAAGMMEVFAGPLVRSSYRAGEVVEKLMSSRAYH
ncbi:MAG: lipoyl synthase [Desulfomonilaceae bacterium]